MDSPAQKISDQLQLLYDYLHQLLDFPAGKTAILVGALWWQAFHSNQLDQQLLAIIPIIWAVDFGTGSVRALMRGEWTPGNAAVGLLRGLIWGLLILVFGLLSRLFGGWVFTAILMAIALTEFGSVLGNVVQMFPDSPLTRLLRAFLGLINRRYAAVVEQVEAAEPVRSQSNGGGAS